MKNMSFIMALSIVTAVFCGAWAYLAGLSGLIAWAGFAGCTTYFASGSHGLQGLKRTVLPNMAGVLCGMAIIGLNNVCPAFGEYGVWCAALTFVMCIIAKFELFGFCPGTFMGCFTTFAANGDWKMLVPSLLAGAALGVACDYGAKWLHKTVGKGTDGT